MREVRQELAVVRQQVRAALVGQLPEAPPRLAPTGT